VTELLLHVGSRLDGERQRKAALLQPPHVRLESVFDGHALVRAEVGMVRFEYQRGAVFVRFVPRLPLETVVERERRRSAFRFLLIPREVPNPTHFFRRFVDGVR
jgi:hypothetical protein